MRLALAGTLMLLSRCGSAVVAPRVGWWPAAARRGCTRARVVMSRRHRRAHLQPPGSSPPAPAGPASALEPATLAGVLEDHHYEQFFFDEPTCDALLALMARHERPLLLCTPSLAVAAERRGQRYLLLDRDERFGFLRSFRAFDLDSPSPLDEAFDAVFCDPPFANIALPGEALSPSTTTTTRNAPSHSSGSHWYRLPPVKSTCFTSVELFHVE